MPSADSSTDGGEIAGEVLRAAGIAAVAQLEAPGEHDERRHAPAARTGRATSCMCMSRITTTTAVIELAIRNTKPKPTKRRIVDRSVVSRDSS